MDIHTKFMKLALDLARKAEGRTSPNPMVGAVIVRDGEIIGEGYHKKAGEPHAEVNAIRSVNGDCKDAVMYVTLEPCCFYRKTPPCTDAIIKAGIKEVHYATVDSNPAVSGEGHRIMEAAGLKVFRGPLEEEARFLNRAFFHAITTGMPWVIAKYAMSLDGCIATAGGESQWITSKHTRNAAHQLRDISDAILVGRGTAVKDNPRLTTRLEGVEVSHPLRVLLDSKGRTPAAVKLFDSELPGKTLVAATRHMNDYVKKTLESRGVEIAVLPDDEAGRVSLKPLLQELGKRGVNTLMVEGGGEVLGSFFSEGLINEIWAFVGARIIGGEKAPGPIGGKGSRSLGLAPRLNFYETTALGPDVLIKGVVAKD